MTQADRLYEHLRSRPHTYMDMLALRISVSPWKRAEEGQHRLRPGERLVKGYDSEGRVTFFVMRG